MLYDRLEKLVFSNTPDHKIQMVIEEYAYSEQDKELARELMEDLRIAYELAKQARAKVIDRMLIGIVLFALSFAITLYTIIVISRVSLWVCAVLVIGMWIAIANLIKLQRPLTEFAPRKSL